MFRFARGGRSPRPSPAARRFDEDEHADWDWLDPDDARLRCGGERKALELSLRADAEDAWP